MKSLQRLTPTLEQSILTKMSKEQSEIIVLSSTSKRFEDYENEDKQKLAKQLVNLSYFVGIKESPSLETLKLLVMFLCKSFPTFSAEELENAFMKACAGEFGDLDHYQNFSPIYVGKLIKAYEQQKMVAKQNYMRLNQKHEEELLDKQREAKYNENPLRNLFRVICSEYTDFVNGKYVDASDIKKIQIKVAIDIAKGKGMFFDFVEKEIKAEDYLTKYFLSLPQDPKEAIEKIKQDVRNNGKNLVNRQG
jgi:hypothetical protein